MANGKDEQLPNQAISNQETSSREDSTQPTRDSSEDIKKIFNVNNYAFYGDTYTSHSIHGDFVGRDPRVFNIEVASLDHPVIASIEQIELSIQQIQRLRGKITRIIPTQERILILQYLHNVSIIQNSIPVTTEIMLGERNASFSKKEEAPEKPLDRSIKVALGLLLPNFSSLFEAATFNVTDLTENFLRKTSKSLKLITERSNFQTRSIAEDYLDELHNIESSLSADMDLVARKSLLRKLSRIIDEANIQISRLDADFKSIIHSSRSSRELIDNMASKISHSEYKNEAKMHLNIVSGLVSRLETDDELLDSNDVLSDEVWSAIGVMTEIEQRRIAVERLIRLDRGAKRFTIASVTIYLTLLIATLSFIYIFSNVQPVADKSLDQLKIRLFEIPWPVVLWSFIGSIAAMIYRFNRNPIHAFGDAVKWMITRPIQGVVLGSTFYLVLVSGLFLLTGENPSGNLESVRVNETILVLAFLVGFSDKFADTIFTTLVERYSISAKSTSENNHVNPRNDVND